MKGLRIILLLLCKTASAGIGDIDQREYVDWSQPPYNNIVYFYPAPYATCTAQYVAPDIIITARHCVTESRTFDKNAELGREFEIWTHDNRRTMVKLEKYGKNFQNDDWALLRVTDPAFFRNDFFDVSNKTQYSTVSSAGFAGLRILSNQEITIAKQVFATIATKKNLTNYNEIFDASVSELLQTYDIWLFDNRKPGSQESGEWEFKLKVTKNCHVESKASRGRFKSSCDTDHGDSGGPYFIGDTLYGIVSGGRSGFDDKTNKNLGVRPERFASDLQKIIKKSAVHVTDDLNPVTVVDIAPDKKLEQTEADLNNRVQKISDMTDGDFFDFLRDATDYQILKENYEAARAREQSLANRMLGGLAIGAAGIGGMQMASAMAEQNADADAERDMTAYLATFHCNYGGGKNVEYGETDVELPGGNDLITLYTEYVNLANDLKVRKAALDMRPGIESEPILESATSGLYDDVAVGKTSGTYASLARALLDPNGADAAAWTKQKADTASKKKTGTIVGGVGALGGAVGNLIINRDKDKEDD